MTCVSPKRIAALLEQTRRGVQGDPYGSPSIIPTRHAALPAEEETFLPAGKERLEKFGIASFWRPCNSRRSARPWPPAPWG
ncbi:hypothetical protein E2C01_054332 [Portunus trituberculatus]|uniref:Uncharacterized protein n=1 Tax=Portunus trituberculatus TaxID=210409 RepID=A0A5B7GRR0_PORTR|nr:hypothetical protein [Portunus trituberculatus]